MNLGLSNKVVLVAGSTRGIGRAVARAFLAEGSRVVVTGRQAEGVNRTVAEFQDEYGKGRILGLSGDLVDSEVIVSVLATIHGTWGRIDCLVANIGTGVGKPGWDLANSDWHTLFDMNLWASVRLVGKVLPGMVEAGRGSIILISSITGLEATAAPLPYSAAKAGLINYAKNLSRQVGGSNVRVNCIAPGNILFPGGSWEKRLERYREEVTRYIEAEVPLRRFGRPEEIANLAVFLASDCASFITGSCIVADGGQTRGL